MSLRRSLSVINHEVAIVNAQIEVLQRREDEFHRLLEEVDRLRNSVRTEKLALEAKGRKLESEKHPLNWLPNELLINIFVSFTEVDEPSEVEELYHRPPMILTHVCHKWRELALSTSSLWSHIFCRSERSSRAQLRAFLERSRACPLHIAFRVSTSKSNATAGWEERRTLHRLLAETSGHMLRWQSIVFRCFGAESMERIVEILNYPNNEFPNLQSLDLSITAPHPAYTNAPSLMKGITINTDNDEFATHMSSADLKTGGLKHLRLQQVPLFSLPTPFYSNLRTLELCFPPQMLYSYEPRYQYRLRVSTLSRCLSLIPWLEELVLEDTVPYIDVDPLLGYVDGDQDVGISQDSPKIIRPVELPHLKRVEWSFPYPADVHRFLAFFIIPSLERLDLSLEELPGKKSNPYMVHGSDGSDANRGNHMHHVLDFGSLKELSVQCVDEDAIGLVLRKLTFPTLEQVEIANVGGRVRRGHSLPPFPRLESIFRDPRLPHLTHLTLSHFEISPEHSISMLGYMPSLTSLSLDTCEGVGNLMAALKDAGTGTVLTGENLAMDGVRRRRWVKVCPRLEALSLWGCGDVEFEGLHAAVRARNVYGDEDGLVEGNGHVTGEPEIGNGNVKDVEIVMERKIKPLRRLRRQVVGGLGNRLESPALIPISTFDRVISTRITIEEASRPSHIKYLRIENCSLISEVEALSLKDMGVDDVSWRKQ